MADLLNQTDGPTAIVAGNNRASLAFVAAMYRSPSEWPSSASTILDWQTPLACRRWLRHHRNGPSGRQTCGFPNLRHGRRRSRARRNRNADHPERIRRAASRYGDDSARISSLTTPRVPQLSKGLAPSLALASNYLVVRSNRLGVAYLYTKACGGARRPLVRGCSLAAALLCRFVGDAIVSVGLTQF